MYVSTTDQRAKFAEKQSECIATQTGRAWNVRQVIIYARCAAKYQQKPMKAIAQNAAQKWTEVLIDGC